MFTKNEISKQKMSRPINGKLGIYHRKKVMRNALLANDIPILKCKYFGVQIIKKIIREPLEFGKSRILRSNF